MIKEAVREGIKVIKEEGVSSFSKRALRFSLWYVFSYKKEQIVLKIKNRWYRTICGSIGEPVDFRSGVKIGCAEKLFVGHNVIINDDVWINAAGGIYIGDNTLIGPRAMILSGNHIFNRLDMPIQSQGVEVKPVIIEEDVWIGASCVILAGVHIGKGSVIGAGAVVTSDIPPYSVAMGVPATVRYSRIGCEVMT
jgi:acetyltransferase-like isoleucine patch superfamily enzyme